jgi:hypothetical protein
MPRPELTMTENKRSIFRADAYKRYLEGKEKDVLPRLISPPVFAGSWLLAGLLFVCAGIAWSAQIPVYASGQAVIVHRTFDIPDLSDDVVAVAFFSPETLPRLRVGTPVFLKPEPSGDRLSRVVVAVQSKVRGPDAAIREFGLSNGAAQRITKPVAVAIVRFAPVSGGLPADAYVGAIYRAEMQVGSRRVLSLLPWIGRFFQGKA